MASECKPFESSDIWVPVTDRSSAPGPGRPYTKGMKTPTKQQSPQPADIVNLLESGRRVRADRLCPSREAAEPPIAIILLAARTWAFRALFDSILKHGAVRMQSNVSQHSLKIMSLFCPKKEVRYVIRSIKRLPTLGV